LFKEAMYLLKVGQIKKVQGVYHSPFLKLNVELLYNYHPFGLPVCFGRRKIWQIAAIKYN